MIIILFHNGVWAGSMGNRHCRRRIYKGCTQAEEFSSISLHIGIDDLHHDCEMICFIQAMAGNKAPRKLERNYFWASCRLAV